MIRQAAVILMAIALTGCASQRAAQMDNAYAASLRQSVANREMSSAEAQRRMIEYQLARQNAASNALTARSAQTAADVAIQRSLDPPPMMQMPPFPAAKGPMR